MVRLRCPPIFVAFGKHPTLFRLFLWLTILLPRIAYGQLLHSLTDAPTLGRAGSGIATTGLPALWLNPAGIAGGQRLGYGATVMQRYGLRELTTVGGGAVYRGFGLQLATVGYGDYRAARFGAVYARRLTDRWRAGAELSVFRQLIIGYGGTTRLLPALGLQYTAGENIVLGLTIKDMPGTGGHAVQIGAGVTYRLGDHLHMLADVGGNRFTGIVSRFGLGYRPVPDVSFQLGYASNPGTLTVGATYRFSGDLLIAVAGAQHVQLGHVAGAGIYRNTEPSGQ